MPIYFDTSTDVGASLSHCRTTLSSRLDRGLRLGTSALSCYHFIKPSFSLGYVTTDLGIGTLSRYKLGPRHTEHINQLSRFHAKKHLVLNFVHVDRVLYFFDKKSFAENFVCQNLICYKQIQIPYLVGGFIYEAILLAYDYTCMALFLVRVLRHNMHHVDLSVPQAGLPCSCVYPYVPDCSARE